MTPDHKKIIDALKFWAGFWYGYELLSDLTGINRQRLYILLREMEKKNLVYNDQGWFLE
jgi:hypothetical protein